jgi:hypothetical protein
MNMIETSLPTTLEAEVMPNALSSARDRMELKGWQLMPKTFAELQDFCVILSKSAFVPKSFFGKPHDIVVVIQMGASLGLNPMQSLQGICSINGIPRVWGKTLRALVYNSPGFAGIEEKIISEGPIDEQGAICTLTHKTRGSFTAKFTIGDAKKAQLYGKGGAWAQYPLVMCGHKAFTRAADAIFSDATMGFGIAEEEEIIQEDQPALNTSCSGSKPSNDGVARLLHAINTDEEETGEEHVG